MPVVPVVAVVAVVAVVGAVGVTGAVDSALAGAVAAAVVVVVKYAIAMTESSGRGWRPYSRTNCGSVDLSFSRCSTGIRSRACLHKWGREGGRERVCETNTRTQTGRQAGRQADGDRVSECAFCFFVKTVRLHNSLAQLLEGRHGLVLERLRIEAKQWCECSVMAPPPQRV